MQFTKRRLLWYDFRRKKKRKMIEDSVKAISVESLGVRIIVSVNVTNK